MILDDDLDVVINSSAIEYLAEPSLFPPGKKEKFPFHLCSTIDSCYLPTSSH